MLSAFPCLTPKEHFRGVPTCLFKNVCRLFDRKKMHVSLYRTTMIFFIEN